jgi:hypothetical protein
MLFDTFVQAYLYGIVAQLNWSARRARFLNTAVRRNSTGHWEKAHSLGCQAYEKLRAAHNMRLDSPIAADQLATVGLRMLNDSTACIPKPELDWSFLDQWELKSDELMRV